MSENHQRVYRSQAEAVVSALESIFVEGRYADKVIEFTLKEDRRRGSADRAFIAETVYDIVRYKRLYQELAEVEQIRGIHACWKMLGAHLAHTRGNLPPWEEFYKISPSRIADIYKKVKHIRKVRESIPDWMDEVGQAQLGKVWDEEIAALNTQAPVVLRMNSLRTDMKTFKKTLAGDGIVTRDVDGCADAVALITRKNVFATEAFKNGMFEVQDASSQKVAILLDPKPGMRVVDACAGAGGKTLHIAALMQNKGSIIAMDLWQNKLDQLKIRTRRARASNITTKVIEGSKTIKRMLDSADRLLLDVPCTGMGVLRRNPDAKWKLSPEFLENVTATQKEILDSYCRIVKVGGMMVYSTCSILRQENEDQVARFLKENDNFVLISQQNMLASKEGYDGFYMALMERVK